MAPSSFKMGTVWEGFEEVLKSGVGEREGKGCTSRSPSFREAEVGPIPSGDTSGKGAGDKECPWELPVWGTGESTSP